MIVELCGARQMLRPKISSIITEIRYRLNSDDFDATFEVRLPRQLRPLEISEEFC